MTGLPMPIQRHLIVLIALICLLAMFAAATPFFLTSGPGPSDYVSVRGQSVELYGYGPYRHMPSDVAVQGLAQDLVTLFVGLPILLASLWLTYRRSRIGYIMLTGSVGYLFVQYTLYLAMAMYNELFLLWVTLIMLSFQVLIRLLVGGTRLVAGSTPPSTATRRFVGSFLIANATLIGLLWLSVVVPPLLDGTLYPEGLDHFTTMIVQGFDLALFLPPSVLAGYYYLRRKGAGDLLAPAYAVFLSLQMTALLAKIVWMAAIGVSAGPALVIIPLLLIGAVSAAYLALRPHRARVTANA
jgi:hypothetical protein